MVFSKVGVWSNWGSSGGEGTNRKKSSALEERGSFLVSTKGCSQSSTYQYSSSWTRLLLEVDCKLCRMSIQLLPIHPLIHPSSIYLSTHSPICATKTHPAIHLSIYPLTHLSTPSIYPSIHSLSNNKFICTPTHPSILFIHLFTHPPIYLFTHLLIHPSTH